MTREEVLNIAKVTGPIVNSEGWLYGGIVDLEKFANVIEKVVKEKQNEVLGTNL